MDVVARLDVRGGEPDDLPVAADGTPAVDPMERDLVTLQNLLPGLEESRSVLEGLAGHDGPPRDPHVVRRMKPEGDLLDPFGDHDP